MGVYLLTIASVDQYYRGTYIVYSAAWRSSVVCQLAGVLATLSSELSVYMLTAITAERAATLLFPHFNRAIALLRVNIRFLL